MIPRLLICVLLGLLAAAPATADTVDDEIDYLIGEVGRDGCTLVRNGKQFKGRDARAHLRSKRRRNAHLVGSTEAFIEKIASQSATSGDPYLIRCRGEAEQSAGDYFNRLLAGHRN